MAWWVALVVALHFVTLAFLLEDPAIAVVGVVQAAGLLAAVPRLRRSADATSRTAGPFTGVTLLLSAVVSAALTLI